MKKTAGILAACTGLFLAGCGGGEKPVTLTEGIEKANEATQRGKEIYKNLESKKGKAEPKRTGQDAFPGPD